MENTTPITFPEDESFDVGSDTRSGVALLGTATIRRSRSPARSTS